MHALFIKLEAGARWAETHSHLLLPKSGLRRDTARHRRQVLFEHAAASELLGDFVGVMGDRCPQCRYRESRLAVPSAIYVRA